MKIKLIKYLLPLCLLFACLGFAACENSPDALSTPQNLRIENGVLYWDEVEYADGYAVYIDGKEFQTAECYFDISKLNEAEIHTLEVNAFNNKGLQSFYVDISYTGKYAIPTVGLEYELLGTGDNPYYTVSKLAVDQNGQCVIPATYQGVSVKNIISNTTSAGILSRIKSLYLPHCIGDSYLSGSRFKDFPNLENIVLGEGNEKFVSEGNCIIEKETNTLVVGCINSEIPDYVTKIGKWAFDTRNIKTYIVPDQITEIGTSAFQNCKVLKKVVLPEQFPPASNLNSVFWGCTSLTEVNIPQGVINLSSAFSGCTSLTEVNIPQGVTNLSSAFSGCTSLTEVNIPEGVTSLSRAFSGCIALVSIMLPDSVQNVSYAFQNCTSLKSVNIPANVSKLEGTFYGCTSLKNFTVPRTVKKLEGAFYGCTSLKKVILGEGVEAISYISALSSSYYGAFGYCVSLTEVQLPSTLARINMFSFGGCVSLQSLEIPDSVTKIEPYAFQNCTSLETIHLSTNLTDFLGHTAFSGCTSLKTIIIPDGITELRSNIFKNCTSLKSIVLPKNVKTEGIIFKDCPLEEIYYRGTEEEWNTNASKLYKNDTVLFSATRYYYSETAPTEEGNYWRFVDGVPTIWE